MLYLSFVCRHHSSHTAGPPLTPISWCPVTEASYSSSFHISPAAPTFPAPPRVPRAFTLWKPVAWSSCGELYHIDPGAVQTAQALQYMKQCDVVIIFRPPTMSSSIALSLIINRKKILQRKSNKEGRKKKSS